MDSFENVVASLLEQDGFWTRPSFKVELTPAEKKLIGRNSSPRWEIDLVAYKGGTNELLIVECKSYLDSGGVNISAFNGKNPKFGNRFKLFTEKGLFPVIKNRLVQQLLNTESCQPNPKVKLLLVAGKIAEKSRKELNDHFKKNIDWEIWDENKIYEKLTNLSDAGYDNTVASVVSKMLLRRNDKKKVGLNASTR